MARLGRIKMGNKTGFYIFFAITMICCIISGWLGNNLYINSQTNNEIQRTMDGLTILGELSYSEAKQVAQNRDVNGDWICVNVNGMSYERAVEIIKHEVGHEIFAEMCEDNIDKCFKIAKEVEDEKPR